MKKTACILGFFLSFLISFSQESGTNLPMGWDPDIYTYPPVILLWPIDMTEIYLEDEINDKDKNQPWRYGIPRKLNLNISDGLWTDLPNGGRIWQLLIHSPGALNISINFSKIEIPKGAKLHIYNDDRTDLSNAFTDSQIYSEHQLGTWFVEGDLVWIEYFEPEGTIDKPVLDIESLIHGYRMGLIDSRLSQRGINEAEACHFDVNCFIGSDFDSHKELLKKSVALLNLGNGYLCSATLINNVENDKTPFLLTANHCLEDSNPALWSARFNWISPEPVCGTGDISINSQTNFTVSGAELRANNTLSDFALVELSNSIPNSWDVVFAGWDSSDSDPLFEVGIHHPNGDIMKICRDDSGAQKFDFNGVETWLIGGGEFGSGNGWEIGTTEKGSSGSPLFNEKGKIIGQLFAGDAGCDGIESNDEYDLYGRFAISWDSGNSEFNRLKDWLDPNNIGVSEIETLQNILNVPQFEFTGDLKVFPNPTEDLLNIRNQRYPKLSYEIYNLIGQKLQSGDASNTLNVISVGQLSEGVYLLRLTDGETNDATTKKFVIKR